MLKIYYLFSNIKNLIKFKNCLVSSCDDLYKVYAEFNGLIRILSRLCKFFTQCKQLDLMFLKFQTKFNLTNVSWDKAIAREFLELLDKQLYNKNL